jgi:hypothetical protein
MVEHASEDNDLQLILSGHYTIKISFLPHSKQEGNHADSIHLYHSSTALTLLQNYTVSTTDPFI